MRIRDLLTLWYLQVKNGDIFKLINPRCIRLWRVIYDQYGLAGIVYIRRIKINPFGEIYTLDGYHNRRRPPLSPTLIAAQCMIRTFTNQYPGKKLYCIFSKKRYRILVLMRELGFVYHRDSPTHYLFIRRR